MSMEKTTTSKLGNEALNLLSTIYKTNSELSVIIQPLIQDELSSFLLLLHSRNLKINEPLHNSIKEFIELCKSEKSIDSFYIALEKFLNCLDNSLDQSCQLFSLHMHFAIVKEQVLRVSDEFSGHLGTFSLRDQFLELKTIIDEPTTPIFQKRICGYKLILINKICQYLDIVGKPTKLESFRKADIIKLLTAIGDNGTDFKSINNIVRNFENTIITGYQLFRCAPKIRIGNGSRLRKFINAAVYSNLTAKVECYGEIFSMPLLFHTYSNVLANNQDKLIDKFKIALINKGVCRYLSHIKVAKKLNTERKDTILEILELIRDTKKNNELKSQLTTIINGLSRWSRLKSYLLETINRNEYSEIAFKDDKIKRLKVKRNLPNESLEKLQKTGTEENELTPLESQMRSFLQQLIETCVTDKINLSSKINQQIEHLLDKTENKSRAKYIGPDGEVFEATIIKGNGDCGYSSLSLKRDDALTLLLDNNHLNAIIPILTPAIKEQLLLPDFIDYARNVYKLNSIGLQRKHKAYETASEKRSNSLSKCTKELYSYANNPSVVAAYLHYDIFAKKIDNGWAHPCVLQALSHIKKFEIFIWIAENSTNKLSPHPHYPHYKPEECKANSRVDLLFTNGNHFNKLCFVSRPSNKKQSSTKPTKTPTTKLIILANRSYYKAKELATKNKTSEALIELQLAKGLNKQLLQRTGEKCYATQKEKIKAKVRELKPKFSSSVPSSLAR